jgi:hypothetical protein
MPFLHPGWLWIHLLAAHNIFLLPGGALCSVFYDSPSHISAVKTNESHFILEFRKLSTVPAQERGCGLLNKPGSWSEFAFVLRKLIHTIISYTEARVHVACGGCWASPSTPQGQIKARVLRINHQYTALKLVITRPCSRYKDEKLFALLLKESGSSRSWCANRNSLACALNRVSRSLMRKAAAKLCVYVHIARLVHSSFFTYHIF